MRKTGKTILFLLFTLAIILYVAGTFDPSRDAARAADPDTQPAPGGTAQAVRGEVDLYEEAVGTVASRTRVGVAAQVTGRVLQVTARPGERVEADTLLVLLDSRELEARLAQSRRGLQAAEANRERQLQAKLRAEALLVQARARHKRIGMLIGRGVATPEQMESAEATLLQMQAGVDDSVAAIAAAKARIEQARQVVTEAEVAVGHARIVAPIDGVVAERLVEPGDLAWSGRSLLVVLDPKALRLEAQVREGLIGRIENKARMQIELPAAGRQAQGTVTEIIPWADPSSRTFRVRVNFEYASGVYPGMFGRLRVPVGKREVVRVPARAIVRVGQLETVLVQNDDRWVRRLVTTGGSLSAGEVEVLSGLKGGETVGLVESR